MLSFGHKLSAGLDIGSCSVKALLLGPGKEAPEVLSCETLRTREEGILTETELYASLAGWLDSLHWDRHDITVGLPQYLATTQVSDFPPGASGGLEEMVAYETQQLAGLSEESFIHDFHVMPPGSGRRNPVLIGICRESAIRERMTAQKAAGIEAVDVGMNGLAATNALLQLHPEVAAAPLPQVVLDLGHENSTLVVLAAGQPLFVGSLLFGAERFTQAYIRKREVGEKEAEREKQSVDLANESPSSPMTEVTRHLVSEIRNAIEHWDAQEQGNPAEAGIGGIWLCGGGACQPGLAQVIGEDLECPTHLFGPSGPESSEPDPRLAVAYGLALQGLRRAAVCISLAPADLRWRVTRDRRFGYLVAACAVFALLMCGLVVRAYQTANLQGQQLKRTMDNLSQCQQLIPRLEDVLAALQYQEARIIPIVEKGNRGRRFVTAIEDLAASCTPEDWFVYLADEDSYQRGKLRGNAATARNRRLAFQSLSPLPGPPSRAPGIGDTVSTPEFGIRILASNLPQMKALIVAGYTPFVPTQAYQAVREIVRKLNASDSYHGVDLLPESERVGREDIFKPWVHFLSSIPKGRYKAFSLVMPFAKLDVKTSPPKKAGTQ